MRSMQRPQDGRGRRSPSMADVAAQVGRLAPDGLARPQRLPAGQGGHPGQGPGRDRGAGLPAQQRRPDAGDQPVRPDRDDLGPPRPARPEHDRGRGAGGRATRRGTTSRWSGVSDFSRRVAPRARSTGCSTRRSRRSSWPSRTAPPPSGRSRSTLPVPVVLVQGVTAGQAMAAGIDQVAGARAGHRAPARPRAPPRRPRDRSARLGRGGPAASRLAGGPRGARPAARARSSPGDWSARSGYDGRAPDRRGPAT